MLEHRQGCFFLPCKPSLSPVEGWKDTKLPQYRRRPPRSDLAGVERGNPDGVWETSKPTARKTETPSGNGNVREANAASRKATGINNRADRAIWPNRKVADVNMVSHPKNV